MTYFAECSLSLSDLFLLGLDLVIEGKSVDVTAPLDAVGSLEPETKC